MTRDYALNMDHPQKPGEKGSGLQPLEVLLASLAGSSVNTLVLLLRRTEQRVRGIEVDARGVLGGGHPAVFTDVSLEFVVRGRDVDAGAVERALLATEQYMCPVLAMLKGGPRVTTSYRIEEL